MPNYPGATKKRALSIPYAHNFVDKLQTPTHKGVGVIDLQEMGAVLSCEHWGVLSCGNR